ncbi:TPA: hypothetical protein ACKR0C_003501 [Pseudomonas aeruginosa]|uniref:hypothetical protein n=1 Tax=Pseudomonas aeruginosa TaxID=287 RepID=UPI000FC3F673|nr:hypothetical protein [Pseudomonas aeruginosa]EKN7497292.1 hypothetical protein [Pseudomonas aeruginosa]EKV5552617.1 hypothetical protein [Pseudomonas aeruginosa]ELL2376891.1 hypothetical protein [Pseudomonas aeruginosa]MBH3630670.1 hypothetical protein [Pseudomonas aeruginosa]MBH4026746.1 hypothetical protein [Pseudomonas aeruginosa]
MKGCFLLFLALLSFSASANEASDDWLIKFSNSALCYAFRNSSGESGVGNSIRKDCERATKQESDRLESLRQNRLYSKECQFWIERHRVNPNSKTILGLKESCGKDVAERNEK